jgi:peptidoglycan/LPS O-acetylase OafA/YrhL
VTTVSAAASDPFETYRRTKVFSALNGIRAVCALGVIKIHCHWSTPGLSFLDHGDLGVDMFFVISGFLIVTLLLREKERHGDISLRKFYARRTLRIFPVYYALILAVLASFLAVAPWKPSGLHFYLPVAAVLLTYTTDIIPMPALGIFFHCWSLAMEEQFYLVWPALEKLLAARVKWVLLALALVVNQLVNFGVLGPVIDRIYGADTGAREMPIFLITFTPIILGVTLAHLLHERRTFMLLYRLVGHRAAPLVLLALVIAIVSRFGPTNQGLPKATLHLTLMIGLGSVVVREDHVLRRVLTFPLIERLGATSYGIYLYHVAILDLMTRLSHGRWSNLTMFLVVAPLAALVAEVSFRYFEGRFLNLRSRFQPSVRPADPDALAALGAAVDPGGPVA